ncbi:MAG: hypothetical protein M1395_03010 [Bacteroidetes bacterium]|nr:hypothetical protein [Bacteroidota bacterium]
MNSKERVKAAMDLKTPDRVPLMCQMSIGHMLQQLPVSPVEFWFDGDTFAEGLLSLREIYGFDGILISLHGHDPNWRNQIVKRGNSEDGEVIRLKDGTTMIFGNDDLPQVDMQEAPKPGLAEINLDDLPKSLDYIPVSQGLHFRIDPRNKFGVIDTIVKRAGKEYSIHGEITSPFDYFLDLLGHQDGLMALIDDREKSKKILAHFAGLIEDLAVEMCDTGIDAIKVSSPFAGSGFISPAFYREFVAPFEARISHSIRKKGVHVYLHTCGAVRDRLELMFDTGASGIECLDPPPLGNVELEEAMKIASKKGFIKGNVDSVNTLLLGTDGDITSDAKDRIEIGKKVGGFILSTACSIAPRVKREKILLLKEAVERWG